LQKIGRRLIYCSVKAKFVEDICSVCGRHHRGVKGDSSGLLKRRRKIKNRCSMMRIKEE